MKKLSLNKAAKEAFVAKSTLLDALKNGKMSAIKDDRGHWQIDPSELFRVFPRTGSETEVKPFRTPRIISEKPHKNHILEVEVIMLREQIERIDAERVRERDQLEDQIKDLRDQAERQSADHRQALAVLTDQRSHPPRKSLWGRIFS